MKSNEGSNTAPKPTPVAKPAVVAPPKPTVVPNSTGQYAKVAAPKPVVAPVAPKPGSGPTAKTNLSQYIGTDVGYQGTLATLQKQLSDFLAGQHQQGVTENTGYANNRHQLGDQEVVAQNGTLDTSAGRGLAHSSLYGNALQGVDQGYTDRFDALDQGHTKFLQGLVSGKTNFMDAQLAAKNKAMSDAASRRATAIQAGA